MRYLIMCVMMCLIVCVMMCLIVCVMKPSSLCTTPLAKVRPGCSRAPARPALTAQARQTGPCTQPPQHLPGIQAPVLRLPCRTRAQPPQHPTPVHIAQHSLLKPSLSHVMGCTSRATHAYHMSVQEQWPLICHGLHVTCDPCII